MLMNVPTLNIALNAQTTRELFTAYAILAVASISSAEKTILNLNVLTSSIKTLILFAAVNYKYSSYF